MYQGRTQDGEPAVIATCLDENDVAVAVVHARSLGLPVAVRGGGHGSVGTAVPDGAFVLDLSRLRDVTADPETLIVTAQRESCSESLTPPHNNTAWSSRRGR